MSIFPDHRPRRLRKNEIIRNMVAETRLQKEMFIYPHFVIPGEKTYQEIASMPGIKRFSADLLLKEAEQNLKLGINKILLFGVGEEKSADGSSSCSHNSAVVQAISKLKRNFGADLYVISDICLCAYTEHGHCGILENEYVQNDESLRHLANMALTHAQAGVDMVAPSDMMDGRVKVIRTKLDSEGFTNTALMSYAVKFASSYYGPFRDAADSAPGKGDRKSYQMDFRNSRESIIEALADQAEGADILMVKPALAYLDIIKTVKENSNLPLACYNVSAEYSMLKIAASAGLVNEQQMVMENMYAFARSGANIIISYHTKEIFSKNWL